MRLAKISTYTVFIGFRKTDRHDRASDTEVVQDEKKSGTSKSDEAIHRGFVSVLASIHRDLCNCFLMAEDLR